MSNIEQAIRAFLANNQYPKFDLKSVFFDMDGVLFDSMPNHALSWHTVMKAYGLFLPCEEAYLHEGRKGDETIKIVCSRQGIRLSDEEIKDIYGKKTEFFNTLPKPERIAGSLELLKQVMDDGIIPMLVTGSGQVALLDSLNVHFPGIFQKERMITAFDVDLGKPHPEPYLKALAKGNVKPWETIVIENAPLGIEAAHRAGLFVIVVNTGPLPDSCLWEAGANFLYSGMPELNQAWSGIVRYLRG
ncbi:MAG: HAD-IA family hydrolase [Tannerella sp.]|jgi:HAD superfamily hydrolase (TIGR01509 family)|nr:HAD-IA family hydrolase [Tannerella sp.]